MRRLPCLLACVLIASGAGAQSLGEAARKEKEKKRRDAAAGETKPYGDDDLAARHPPAEKPAADKPAPTGTDAAAIRPGAASPGAKPTPVPSPTPPSWLKGLNEDDKEGEKAQPPAGTEPSSAMDELKKKNELWQGKYRTKKREVEALEKEVAALEKQVAEGGGSIVMTNPMDVRTNSGYVETVADVAARELREKRAA